MGTLDKIFQKVGLTKGEHYFDVPDLTASAAKALKFTHFRYPGRHKLGAIQLSQEIVTQVGEIFHYETSEDGEHTIETAFPLANQIWCFPPEYPFSVNLVAQIEINNEGGVTISGGVVQVWNTGPTKLTTSHLLLFVELVRLFGDSTTSLAREIAQAEGRLKKSWEDLGLPTLYRYHQIANEFLGSHEELKILADSEATPFTPSPVCRELANTYFNFEGKIKLLSHWKRQGKAWVAKIEEALN